MISRTPFRVSFVGGGSDLPSFARKYGGAVISTTIDKYVYVIVTERFEGDLRVSYSKTEIVDSIEKVKHELIRESLRLAGLPRKVEIVTVADVPAKGTGLGSSSAVTVGALNALFAYQGILKSAGELAEYAAEIEIDTLGKPIGKQDQYASAFGGLQLLRFGPGDVVRRDPVVIGDDARRELERSLLMFYTGKQRSASRILKEIDATSERPSTRRNFVRLRDLALELYEDLGRGDPAVLGEYLHKGWEQKRRLAGVSDPQIDAWYAAARKAGALGGKLLGAGGGGFLLFFVPRDSQAVVRKALKDLREVPIALEEGGSRIIHLSR